MSLDFQMTDKSKTIPTVEAEMFGETYYKVDPMWELVIMVLGFALGINKITESNFDEVCKRWDLLTEADKRLTSLISFTETEKIYHPITHDDLREMIGLSTNGSVFGIRKFKANLKKLEVF